MTDVTRPLLAALLNADLAAALGEVLTQESTLTDSRRAAALEKLRQLGLIDLDERDARVNSENLRQTLTALAKPRPTGLDRFLTEQGRVDRYPSDTGTRIQLLEMLAARVLSDHERVEEVEFTTRLSGLADDAVLLRRHLIDYGVVNRTADGAEYWLTARP